MRDLSEMPKMAMFQNIVDEKTAAKFDGVLIDLFSASIVVSVHKALNEKNKTSFEKLDAVTMVKVACQLIK